MCIKYTYSIMKHSELRLYLQFNIINCMFHIKLFLKGCFVSEVSKGTPSAKLTRGFISSYGAFPIYALAQRATPHPIYDNLSQRRGGFTQLTKTITISVRWIVDYLPFVLLDMDSFTKNHKRLTIMTFLVVCDNLTDTPLGSYSELPERMSVL